MIKKHAIPLSSIREGLKSFRGLFSFYLNWALTFSSIFHSFQAAFLYPVLRNFPASLLFQKARQLSGSILKSVMEKLTYRNIPGQQDGVKFLLVEKKFCTRKGKCVIACMPEKLEIQCVFIPNHSVPVGIWTELINSLSLVSLSL